MEHFAEQFTDWLELYGYPVLFLGVLLENAGLPVPGETAVLLAGVLASRPESHFKVWAVILVTVIAAVVGDNIGFYLGHRFARPRLQQGRRFLFLTPKTLEVIEGYFNHYGTWTIFVARFISGLRVVAALAAGTAGMHWTRFLVANTAGAAAWAATMTLLGYFFGQSWQLLHHWLGRGGIILLGCVVVLVGLPYLLRRLHHLAPGAWQSLLRNQVVVGLLAALLETLCLALLVHLANEPPPAHEDREVHNWLATFRAPWLDHLAVFGSYLGTLPVMFAVTAAMSVWLWRARRPWREQAFLWGVLAGSEVVGLLLLTLIRHRGVEPAHALAWPFGFAGLAPFRATAVAGAVVYLTHRLHPGSPWPARVGAGFLVVLVTFSVVWLHEQRLTEVCVEVAAGAVILFLGVGWLEGYGPAALARRPDASGAVPPAAAAPVVPAPPAVPGEE